MTRILLLTHGSRDPDQKQQMDAILRGVKLRFPQRQIESVSLQFGDESALACLKRMAQSGAQDILIIPCFLFDGIHTKKNIPKLVEGFQQDYPSIQVKISDVLGTDKQVIDIVSEKITKLIK